MASYTKVTDIDQCWMFSRMFQQPQYVQASSLQMACLRFLQGIGVPGHIRVIKGTSDLSN